MRAIQLPRTPKQRDQIRVARNLVIYFNLNRRVVDVETLSQCECDVADRPSGGSLLLYFLRRRRMLHDDRAADGREVTPVGPA